jgi:hypothetical protein
MSPPIHPLAERLPTMPEEEFRELVESIREHGLKESLWLYEGQVLDGRHRARACDELGVEPSCRQYEGNEPVGFVIDANVHRRHLSAGQRAALAIDFMPELEAEARARQGHRTDLDPTSGPSGPEVPVRARDLAAARVGASPRSVARAKRVQEHAPEKLEEVRAGEKSIQTAETEVLEELGRPEVREHERASKRQGRAPMGARESKQQARMLEQITERCRHISDIAPHVNHTQISELSEEERQKWLPQLRETRMALSRLIGAL